MDSLDEGAEAKHEVMTSSGSDDLRSRSSNEGAAPRRPPPSSSSERLGHGEHSLVYTPTRQATESRDSSSSSNPHAPVHSRGPSSGGSVGRRVSRGKSGREERAEKGETVMPGRSSLSRGKGGTTRGAAASSNHTEIPSMPGAGAGASGPELRGAGGDRMEISSRPAPSSDCGDRSEIVAPCDSPVGVLDEDIRVSWLEDAARDAWERQQCRRTSPHLSSPVLQKGMFRVRVSVRPARRIRRR